MFIPWEESYNQPRQHIQKQRHYFANKGLSSQGYVFSSGRVWMWELDCEEGWALKNWCFWTVVLEKTLESPLDYNIKPVHPKGDQSWVFIGRTDVEAETPILWPSEVKSWFIWKTPWCWETLRAGGEGDDRGLDGWMATLTQWIRVWVSSGSWWWTGRPGVLQLWVAKSQTLLSNWAKLMQFLVLRLGVKPRPPALGAWNLGHRSPGKSHDFAILGIRYEPSTLQVSLSPPRIAGSSLSVMFFLWVWHWWSLRCYTNCHVSSVFQLIAWCHASEVFT